MQDAEMLPRALIHAERVLLTGLKCYVYVKRVGSFVNSENSNVRIRYFESVIEVRDRLKQFKDQLTRGSPIELGVRKKINVIEEILFLSLIYETADSASRSSRIEHLAISGVYPFNFQETGRFGVRVKRRILRWGLNLSPVQFLALYSWVRGSVHRARSTVARFTRSKTYE